MRMLYLGEPNIFESVIHVNDLEICFFVLNHAVKQYSILLMVR